MFMTTRSARHTSWAVATVALLAAACTAQTPPVATPAPTPLPLGQTFAPTPLPLCQLPNGTLVPCTPAPPASGGFFESEVAGRKWEIALVAVCASILLVFICLTVMKRREKARRAKERDEKLAKVEQDVKSRNLL